MGPKATLAKRQVRQAEAINEQQVALKQDEDDEGSVRAEIRRMKLSKPKESPIKQACWRRENHHEYGNASQLSNMLQWSLNGIPN